ncbi:MAG: geranylgeranylglycerol-phosphate geranylgeranyltransferase, partial [Candidatus Marinimicrobia bacterium]|nr:geranylgeranylglycerol-phosphate geranylgeranyltransferase [Candidatus Neomarinimicrobiota bacterium]
NALNDYCDAEIDRINRPNRPIPQGCISRKEALVFAVGLFVLGSLLACPILSPELSIIVGVALVMLIGYSLYFKVRPLFGNLMVSLILGMAFLFAATVFGDIRKGIPPFFLAFGFTLIREIVKDIQDMEGDRTVNARTIPLSIGIPSTRRLIFFLTVVLMIGAPIPYYFDIYGIFYLLVLIFTVEIPLVYFLYSISHDSSSENCGRLSSLLKADIFLGLLAIFLGRY